MTIKETAKRFGLNERDIWNIYKDGMIRGATKVNGRISIPDETTIILSKRSVRYFLLELLKLKNNPCHIFNREHCETDEKLLALINYLYQFGYIGEPKDFESSMDLLSLRLTDKGMDLCIGHSIIERISSPSFVLFQFNATAKIGLVNF